MFKRTTAINKLLKLEKRKKVIQGGTSAGKTFGILPVLIDRAAKTPHLEISVVSETIPHLRRGAIKDFLKIMEWTNRYVDANWNRSLLTYKFANGSYIEFFSAEQESKLRGARRNVLYINEANNISFEAYHQLAIRTSGEIWLDFNPTAEFWAHTEVLKDNDSEHIILTYKDNEALPETIIHDIEQAQHKAQTSSYWANWWKVYGLGLIGSLQGVVFDNWKQIEKIPTDAKLLGYGMDFGFTNDPTTLIAVYKTNNQLYFDEVLYRTNMTNNEIGNFMKSEGIGRPYEIVADSAEPKSIEELRRQGFMITPATKGPDSIKIGIDILKRENFFVTQSSINLIKELRSYVWDTDRDGKLTGKPVDYSNHCFIGETLITTNKGLKRIDEIKIGDNVLTSKGYKKVQKVFNNGLHHVNKYSIQLDTNTVYLTGTNNHKIKTTKSWTELSKLKKGQQIFQHKPLKGSNIACTMEKSILVEEIKDFIQKFGNFIKEKYLKTIMYIMLMGIKIITKYQILTLYIKHYIKDSKRKKDLKTIQSLLKVFMQKELRLQKNGTNQNKELNGIKRMVKSVGLINLLQIKYANNAEKIIKQDTRAYLNTAIKTVKLLHFEQGESYKAQVYDLMIEDCHEYFANGILVHNCVDAMRYFALNKLNNRPSGKYATMKI
jgi:phage terminase large subunit